MVVTDTYTPGRRLAWLARRVAHFDRPYLITGPQAAYEYHRWLTSLENLATLQVYAEDVPVWRQVGRDGCRVFETPPTIAQVHTAQEAVILDPTLDPKRWRRRHVIDELAFIAPEDLCLDLLERARGETSLAEAAAIIIVHRDALTWDILLDQAERRGLARRLGVLLEVINTEAEAEAVPAKIIEDLSRRVDTTHVPAEIERYPVGRHRSTPPSYRPIGDRWGMELVLPRYVIGKVAFDLQPQRK